MRDCLNTILLSLVALSNHAVGYEISNDYSYEDISNRRSTNFVSRGFAEKFPGSDDSKWREAYFDDAEFLPDSLREGQWWEKKRRKLPPKNLTKPSSLRDKCRFCFPQKKKSWKRETFHRGDTFFAFHKVRMDTPDDPLTHQPYHKAVLAISASKVDSGKTPGSNPQESTQRVLPIGNDASAIGSPVAPAGVTTRIRNAEKHKNGAASLWSEDGQFLRKPHLHRGRHRRGRFNDFNKQLRFLKRWLTRIERHRRKSSHDNYSGKREEIFPWENDQT